MNIHLKVLEGYTPNGTIAKWILLRRANLKEREERLYHNL